MLIDVDPARRFGGIDRLYGTGSIDALHAARACVIGIGGVGSWAVEALARSGVGRLTLIDLDHVAESNINRQAHALDATLGMAKVEAMAARIAGIHPACRVEVVEDFVTPENAGALLHGFDVVIDAIDNVRAKVAVAAICRERRIPLVMAGGAGGKSDPARICVDDLARTIQDPLLSKVRARLRKEHGFTRDPKKKFGIEAVFSTEPLRYPAVQVCDVDRHAGTTHTAPQGLACAGYGSSMAVTASVGLFCASRALEHLLRAGVRRLEHAPPTEKSFMTAVHQPDSAIVLFGHGARDPEWAGPMRRIRDTVLARPDAPKVELAFLEFMSPTLPEAIAALAEGGVRKVAVVPVFLAQGGHLKRDLPVLLDEARAAHPGCEIMLATAAGEADPVVRAMADYAASCLG